MGKISKENFDRYYMLHGRFNVDRYVSEIVKDAEQLKYLEEGNSFPGEKYSASKAKELNERIVSLKNAAEEHVPSNERERLEMANQRVNSNLERLKDKQVKSGNTLLKKLGPLGILILFAGSLILLSPSITGGSITGGSITAGITGNAVEASRGGVRNFFGVLFFALGLFGTYLLIKNK